MKTMEELVNEIPMTETVLITGGAGSLGKAFVRLLHKTHRVVVIDSNEWAVAELRKEYPDVEVHLMDFADWRFDQIPCEYVLHLAAYKHIDIGEESVMTFVDNNINKSALLFEEAFKYNVNLMFMSTDKAVEPTSVYGYTKAIIEQLAFNSMFAVARSGNFINSSGSVIPTWEKAINDEAPIPITDERMKRWVIEDYDAALQIWDMFKSGKQLIIPKCKEVRIMDLLTTVLKRHGYEKASDYKPGIEIIGRRPGEKLTEKLEWE